MKYHSSKFLYLIIYKTMIKIKHQKLSKGDFCFQKDQVDILLPIPPTK